MGDGENTLFWTDRWINGRNAGEIAPEVVALVPTRRRNARKVSEALQDDTWLSDAVGELSIERMDAVRFTLGGNGEGTPRGRQAGSDHLEGLGVE